MYRIPLDQYNNLMRQNVTAEYKKTKPDLVNEVNVEAAKIATNLEIADRIDEYMQASSFITIKDHKPSFPGRIECRLLNPAKSNIGKISKAFLDKTLSEIKHKTNSNQWKNSWEVIDWFKSLQNKHSLTFFKFDIVSFYPSIKEELLDDTIEWSKQYTTITDEQLAVMKNARKSFLFFEDSTWIKKNNSNFDVSMGSYDGAEICELVGLFILHKLEQVIEGSQVGLYRDDGLAVVRGSGPEVEKLRKRVFQIFKSLGLKVTIEANMNTTDFLDIVFNLGDGSYKPFRKENQTPMYVHCKSNHPPNIKKQLPSMISERLSNLSCSKSVFENESEVYQNSLKLAGYTDKLMYKNQNAANPKKKKRIRNVTWFNPPYSESVKTNVGGKFLDLIDKHFKNTELDKFFNRSTIKVSYSCLPNLEAIISGTNKKVMNKSFDNNVDKKCNCRGGEKNCPMDGECLEKEIVYKAETKVGDKISSYIGLTASTFKERYRNHVSSFNHSKYEHHTGLSRHIWGLKKENKKFEISWSKVSKAPAYTPINKKCNLCLLEKIMILNADEKTSLNKKTELMNKCPHRRKYLLSTL